jgi:serine/threonine-protein kinase
MGAGIFAAHTVNTLRVSEFQARRLGQYELTEKIGCGGMGEVWKAKHRLLARPAAIKLIRRDVLGNQSDETVRMILKRFEREAQATAALTSPNAIVIYDFGTTEDAAFYYVMELLDGMDLGSLVKRFGPVQPERTIAFLTQACEALSDAHHRGLIHRDIKPANLFVCRLGQVCDFVKVLDFGLVKSLEAASEGSAQLTQFGTVTGTPACISPEQALGEEVDARSDIYSLGCVGYWLLTGQQVFVQSKLTAMLVDHVKTPPVPPGERTEVMVPADLEGVIMRCLEKEPRDRPQSADSLKDQLLACEDAGKWGRDEATRWWNSHLGAQRSQKKPSI